MSDIRDLIRVATVHAPAPATDLPEVPLYVDDERPEVTSGSKSHAPWRIEDEGGAEWALEKKGEADGEVARIGALAEAKIKEFTAKVRARVDEIVAPQKRRAAFFEAVLLEFMDRRRGHLVKGQAKSRKFLFGTLGWRQAPRKLVYDDEKAATAWAREQGLEAGLVRIEMVLNRDAVKLYCERHEVVPTGAHWEGGLGVDVPYVKTETPVLPVLQPTPATTTLLLVKETP